jgi:cytidine deaminase
MSAQQTELFIALVAAIGTDLTMVTEELESELREYRYTTHTIRLSAYLSEIANDLGMTPFGAKPLDERLWDAMTAGDRLRLRWGRGDALALWAVANVAAIRERLATTTVKGPDGSVPANLDRHAFVFRSLKTPDELRTLRAVYGERLFVIAAYSPEHERRQQLAEAIRRDRRQNDRTAWSHKPDDLIRRDLNEEIDGGQNVSDTFHRADFFIRAWDRDTARKDLVRTLEILFGHPYRTPTREEHGQFIAAGAARRSAELGRQVGAAITADGSVVAVGTNEVPRFGGGSHWEEDGAGNREFEVRDVDTNRAHQEEIARRIAEALKERFSSVLGRLGVEDIRAATDALADGLDAALLAGGLKEITEYGRAVHAEMSAVLDAARRGVPIDGCTVHTTTFPCHNCMRHLVGAGVRRLVFVEPYPKSRARDLHEDSIAMDAVEPENAVEVKPFVGVAPRRYLSLFDAVEREELAGQPRKTADHRVREFDKTTAVPLFTDLEPEEFRLLLPSYRTRELLAMARFDELRRQHSTHAAQPVDRVDRPHRPTSRGGGLT